MKTGLHMKFQNGASGDSDGSNIWTLRESGTRKQTDGTQNCSQGMAHGLGLSSSEKREQHNNCNFAGRDGQRESRRRGAYPLPRPWTCPRVGSASMPCLL